MNEEVSPFECASDVCCVCNTSKQGNGGGKAATPLCVCYGEKGNFSSSGFFSLRLSLVCVSKPISHVFVLRGYTHDNNNGGYENMGWDGRRRRSSRWQKKEGVKNDNG